MAAGEFPAPDLNPLSGPGEFSLLPAAKEAESAMLPLPPLHLSARSDDYVGHAARHLRPRWPFWWLTSSGGDGPGEAVVGSSIVVHRLEGRRVVASCVQWPCLPHIGLACGLGTRLFSHFQ